MYKKLKIALVEPFYGGSHKKWADELKANSKHSITIFSLKSLFWKWRMQGGAITLAHNINDSQIDFDLLLTTDMMNVSLFKSLLNKPFSVLTYFHENQFAYPNQSQIDFSYPFINYQSALCSDWTIFNSNYNRNSFIQGCKNFLKRMPDNKNLSSVTMIQDSSCVIPIGFDTDYYKKFNHKKDNIIPTICWNHRWEYDKNPESFFRTLQILKEKKFNFSLVVLGESTDKYPAIFDKAQKEFTSQIIHWGHVKNHQEYLQWLCKSDIFPVTSNHDFFGISVIEAVLSGGAVFLPQRLAYPEHIPKKHFQNVFYQTEQELADKIINFASYPTKEIREYIESKYNWKKLVAIYDDLFEKF